MSGKPEEQIKHEFLSLMEKSIPEGTLILNKHGVDIFHKKLWIEAKRKFNTPFKMEEALAQMCFYLHTIPGSSPKTKLPRHIGLLDRDTFLLFRTKELSSILDKPKWFESVKKASDKNTPLINHLYGARIPYTKYLWREEAEELSRVLQDILINTRKSQKNSTHKRDEERGSAGRNILIGVGALIAGLVIGNKLSEKD